MAKLQHITANKAGNNTAPLSIKVLAKDKSPPMNNIVKEYGEPSISSNKKDEESWDAVLSSLNYNASIFAPRNNAKAEPRQRERSWDGRVIEDVNIRRPPMRKAKQKQVDQTLLSISKNKI